MIVIVVLWYLEAVLLVAVDVEDFLLAESRFDVVGGLPIAKLRTQLTKGHLVDYLLILSAYLCFSLHGWQTMSCCPEVSCVTRGRHKSDILGRRGTSCGSFLRRCGMALNRPITEESIGSYAQVAPLLVRHLLHWPGQSKVMDCAFFGITGRSC